ncbi:MAG: cytochrome P450 [Acidimicrobiales bacterium]
MDEAPARTVHPPVLHQVEVQDWPRDREVPPPETTLDLDDINLADPATWGRPDIHGILWLRREERPIARDEHRSTGDPFWSFTRWDHIAAISADHATFSNAHGVAAANDRGAVNAAEGTIISMDPPLHTLMRKVVNKGFTPRQVRALAPAVNRRVDEIIERLQKQPTGPDGRAHVDFVDDVAMRLPAAVICDMMGIPEEDQGRMVELTGKSLTPNEYGLTRHDIPRITAEIDDYGLALGEDRLANPQDDLTSLLVTGQIADQPLAADQVGPFFRLLILGGNETTRNALSHGMLALTEWPEERQRWIEALGTEAEDEVAWSAAEEIVRWASPVIHMKRDATRDVVMGDDETGRVEIAEGEKVVIWYPSANRDPRHFPDPYRFDIMRNPNHQGGFGTGGAHFCLGANLARREIAITLSEVLRNFPDMTAEGQYRKVRSNFLHVVAELPVSYTP